MIIFKYKIIHIYLKLHAPHRMPVIHRIHKFLRPYSLYSFFSLNFLDNFVVNMDQMIIPMGPSLLNLSNEPYCAWFDHPKLKIRFFEFNAQQPLIFSVSQSHSLIYEFEDVSHAFGSLMMKYLYFLTLPI
jgi:hypothetical protein